MMIVMRCTMYGLMTLLGFIALFSCTRKEDGMDGICVDDTRLVAVSASLPDLKSPSYVELSTSQMFAHDYVNPEEASHNGIVQEKPSRSATQCHTAYLASGKLAMSQAIDTEE